MKKPIVYWTSRALRVRDNPALSLAQHLAISMQRPLKVVFIVYPHFPYANVRNMHFLLSGLKEMQTTLHSLHIPLECVLSDPIEYFKSTVKEIHSLVMDHHVLKPVLKTQDIVINLCKQQHISAHRVSVATVVPVDLASPKLEFAAKTFRPKIMKIYEEWLNEADPIVMHPYNEESLFPILIDVEKIIEAHPHWKSLPLSTLVAGEKAGYQQLDDFITNDLIRYEQRNEINSNAQSYLSAYLHFGMISPKVMISKVKDSKCVGSDLFIEEAMVRRELAENYCYYNKHYDSLQGAWPWAIETLNNHLSDQREYIYDLETFESALTHDALWNFCMNTMKETGYLHSYLRMYWAKMVLYWTSHPQDAIDILIHLNDTYFLDGRDPNGYTGIMWSVAGVHDRPWFNRPVIGLIRAMGKEGTLKKTKVRL